MRNSFLSRVHWYINAITHGTPVEMMQRRYADIELVVTQESFSMRLRSKEEIEALQGKANEVALAASAAAQVVADAVSDDQPPFEVDNTGEPMVVQPNTLFINENGLHVVAPIEPQAGEDDELAAAKKMAEKVMSEVEAKPLTPVE